MPNSTPTTAVGRLFSIIGGPVAAALVVYLVLSLLSKTARLDERLAAAAVCAGVVWYVQAQGRRKRRKDQI